MSARIKSEATHEKFNNKVIKYLNSIGAKEVESGSYAHLFELPTSAGKLVIKFVHPSESAVFSIYGQFEDVTKANTVREAGELPFQTQFNRHSGKYNFHSTNEKKVMEEFTSALKRLHTPGYDITYRVQLKGENLPVFIEGEAPGVIAIQTVTYNVTEEVLTSPMCLNNINEFAQELLKRSVEVSIEYPKEKQNGKKRK